MTERCSWALLITFAIGSGAFREGRVFSNFEGISGWGVKTSECMVLSSCCRQQAQFLFQNVDLYKSLLGCENYHCARAPRTAIMIFPVFP